MGGTKNLKLKISLITAVKQKMIKAYIRASRLRLYTSVRRNAISSRFIWHEILAWFLSRKFRQVFYAEILCQKFWHGASILAQNFGTEFRHEIPCQKFWQVFPCQNSEPKFWDRAKTFGKKWYFGTQMNRPVMSKRFSFHRNGMQCNFRHFWAYLDSFL